MNINAVTLSNDTLEYRTTQIHLSIEVTVTKQSNMDTLGMMYNCQCIRQYCTHFAATDSSCCPSNSTLQASLMAWKYLA